MTEKRYFKREWEEEYYIFDSQVISEKEFDEKVEYEDYQAFADSMAGDTVVNRLNELHEIYIKLKHKHSLLHDECTDLEVERNRLQNDVNSLEKENKEIKRLILTICTQIEVDKINTPHPIYLAGVRLSYKEYKVLKTIFEERGE